MNEKGKIPTIFLVPKQHNFVCNPKQC